MSKPKTETYAREREHKARCQRKRKRIDGLLALMATYEQKGNNNDEVKRLAVKIRVLRQQLIYMEQ
jgi:hypothetical protein